MKLTLNHISPAGINYTNYATREFSSPSAFRQVTGLAIPEGSLSALSATEAAEYAARITTSEDGIRSYFAAAKEANPALAGELGQLEKDVLSRTTAARTSNAASQPVSKTVSIPTVRDQLSSLRAKGASIPTGLDIIPLGPQLSDLDGLRSQIANEIEVSRSVANAEPGTKEFTEWVDSQRRLRNLRAKVRGVEAGFFTARSPPISPRTTIVGNAPAQRRHRARTDFTTPLLLLKHKPPIVCKR